MINNAQKQVTQGTEFTFKEAETLLYQKKRGGIMHYDYNRNKTETIQSSLILCKCENK